MISLGLLLSLTSAHAFFNLVQPKNEPTNIVEDINDFSAKNVVMYIEQTKNPTLVINSNGGSVLAGRSIIRAMSKKKVHCIVEKAMSMGFSLLPHCSSIEINKFSDLMQHMTHAGKGREELEKEIAAGKVPKESVNALKYMDTLGIAEESFMLCMSVEEYKNKIKYSTWFSGMDFFQLVSECGIIPIKLQPVIK